MIAYRIIRLRKSLGITQAQLARKLNVSASAEANYEQGRRIPNIDTLTKMSRIFNVSLDYLITGKEYVVSDASSAAISEESCPCATCYWAKQ